MIMEQRKPIQYKEILFPTAEPFLSKLATIIHEAVSTAFDFSNAKAAEAAWWVKVGW